ncbi:MAG: flagellar assembly peptidoglycan hydrolase FlgJ [Methylomonas sp.]
MLNTDTSSVYTDFNGLAKLKQGAREQSPQAIKEVAKQFESVFLSMVLKSMRQAKLSDGILDGKQSEFFRDMYDQQMAVQLAGKPGVGLADLMVKQLSPKQAREDENEKMDAGDYINRAAGAKGSAAPVRQNLAVGSSAAKPMDLSGLTSLERSLARLEISQRSVADHWQSVDDEWQALKTGDDQPIPSKQEFMNQMLPHAQQAATALGVDANLLLAQAALETGWGQSVIKNSQGDSSYNLFNIKANKAWQGKQAKVMTLEYDGGVARKEMAGFRSYDSYKDSFDDYVNLIKSNPRYSEALKKAGNPAQYMHELQQAGYATDPRYAEKVMSIYNSQTPGQGRAISNVG